MRYLYRIIIICIIMVTAWMSARAHTAFDDFESQRSVELTNQATKLARWAVESRLRGEDMSKLPFKIHPLLMRRAGVFVTISKSGNPRGCLGTIEPTQPNAAREIIASAIGAAFSDSRRRPLEPRELSKVRFHVSIMGPLRPVSEIGDLAPERLGLLVRSGSQSGILLPGEAKTASWQIKECKRKAGIPAGMSVHMFVFRTVLLEEREKSSSR
ncbi:MAG: AmmeMemoRadiSam system protein A [Armatimonadota bacterium]